MTNHFWNGRRVFITGANGFLASWMVKDLVDKGAQVVSLVFEKNPLSIFEQEQFDQKTETITGDVLNYNLIKDIISKFKIQTVFHVGAQAICATAEQDPMATLDINIKGTYHVLEAARQASHVVDVVVASSDKAYGVHKQLPYKEDFPLHGEFPYEVSKSCADLVTAMYWNTYKLPVAIVRCGNLYGGGDAHFSRLIPATVKRLFFNQSPVILADSLRDYLYVTDAVRGYLVLAEGLAQKRCLGESFNFGTESPRSVTHVIAEIGKIMRKEHLKPQTLAGTHLGIPEQYLSSEKAGRMLGWRPQVDFDTGLKETIAWYSRYFERHGLPITSMSNLSSYDLGFASRLQVESK